MKTRKVPIRTCVVSREAKPKNELTRVVINKEGEVNIDTTGKMNGRGAYIFLTKENVTAAKKKKVLEKVLKTTNLDEIYLELENLCDG